MIYFVNIRRAGTKEERFLCFAIVPASYARNDTIKMFAMMEDVESFELI